MKLIRSERVVFFFSFLALFFLSVQTLISFTYSYSSPHIDTYSLLLLLLSLLSYPALKTIQTSQFQPLKAWVLYEGHDVAHFFFFVLFFVDYLSVGLALLLFSCFLGRSKKSAEQNRIQSEE